jgi:lipopolysaccharide export system permease protein
MSAWQFVSPALLVAFFLGILATTIYNPVSAVLQERSKRYEAQLFGEQPTVFSGNTGTFWVRQRSDEGEAIINAKSSSGQGIELNGVSVFTFDKAGHFKERVEAHKAVLEPGVWRLTDTRVFVLKALPREQDEYLLKTNLTPEQVRESFATPETVPFWELPLYINIAEHAGLIAAGYRLQFQKLLARPFLFAAMVFLAAAVSLRFFRFGGVQKMVLSGVASGFLLYVLSKVTEDLSKAELMHPVAAAWLPVLVGGVTGFIALLYQEDG